MYRWRHRRITFSEALTPEIPVGLVYSDNAQPPQTTVVVAAYGEGGGTTTVDRLLNCTITEQPDGVIAVTGLSTWLTEEVRVPIDDATMTVYVHPNPQDCVGCR